jgi:alkylated DNA repair dioxygenase AlkB
MSVPGLKYSPNFITPDIEKEVVDYLDTKVWSTKLKRRTQHYGFEYNYSNRSAKTEAPPMEGIIKKIADVLNIAGIMNPEQCIINEYLQDQGISAHIDAPTSFGDTIVSISLLYPCNMIFTKDEENISIPLEARSIVILTGDARYLYKHEIRGNKKVILSNGETYTKPANYRRVSLTFRTMKK